MTEERITNLNAALIFGLFTCYFFLLLYTLLPFLKNNFIINSSLYWFIIGYFLFIPIFLFPIAALPTASKKSFARLKNELFFKPFSKRDWAYAITGLLLTIVLTGIIFLGSFVLNKYFNVRMIKTTPWFIEMQPYEGIETLYLLVWLPMFFFNIVGEEILWRGYIQSRLKGKYSWLLCTFLWLGFHLPFGLDLMIMLVPVMIIIPYIFSKTQNTAIGIFIHGLYNGPTFIAVALGLLK